MINYSSRLFPVVRVSSAREFKIALSTLIYAGFLKEYARNNVYVPGMYALYGLGEGISYMYGKPSGFVNQIEMSVTELCASAYSMPKTRGVIAKPVKQ